MGKEFLMSKGLFSILIIMVVGVVFSGCQESITGEDSALVNDFTKSPQYVLNVNTVTNVVLDEPGNVGLHSSLVLDNDSHMHVSYFDASNRSLKYAYIEDPTDPLNTIQTETIDDGGGFLGDVVGLFTSLSIDSTGVIHITYYDNTNHNLKYATGNLGNWNIETIDATGTVGKESSITVDHNDVVHVSYMANQDLKYLHGNYGAWSAVEFVDLGTNIGPHSSIAVDQYDEIHICYFDRALKKLKYATGAYQNWQTAYVDPTANGVVGLYCDIAVDDNDVVHLSYFAYGDLKYAFHNIGALVTDWTVEYVDTQGYVGLFTSIDYDSFGAIHISYYDSDEETLKYASRDPNGDWEAMTADDGSGNNVGKWSALAVDVNDNINITYFDKTDKNLKYATIRYTFDEPVLTTEVVATGNGEWNSIAIDSNNYVYIAHNEGDYVRIINNVTGVWDGETDPNDNNCMYMNIGLDSVDNIHVVYYGYSHFWHLTNETGIWEDFQVHPTGNGQYAGKFNSLWIDDNDAIHAVYNFETSVYYATNETGVWDKEEFEADAYDAFIVQDANGMFHVSYQDSANYDLKYAYGSWGNWTTETIDNSLDQVGSYSGIAIDDSDINNIKKYVMYFNYTDRDLYLATYDNGWTIELLDTATHAGWYAKMAMDHNYKLHIVYYYDDGSGETIRYATNRSGNWEFMEIDNNIDLSESMSIAIDLQNDVHVVHYDQNNDELKYTNIDWPPLN
ncbi:MAG: hypothetical protein ABII18_02820 [bacterium]|nr:hypothetical protein [bacterium]MBU1916677.1 hypothetical protein [bacterium]